MAPRTARFVAVVLAVAAAVALPHTASPAPRPQLPNSIAALGDSVTRAVDVCCWYGEYPEESWSTGGNLFDGVLSHYERLFLLKPSILGRSFNDARATGGKMSDAAAQALTAVSQRAEYVTILLGGNDACTSSPATITSVEDFRAQFTAAMNVLSAGLPNHSHVFVSSIPNLYRLWQLGHLNGFAQFVWSVARICQSMLSPYNSEADRQAVLARVESFNDVLNQVCGQYSFCRFDDYATFEYPFSAAEISPLDFYHPSLAGQAALASLTWQHSWWAPR